MRRPPTETEPTEHKYFWKNFYEISFLLLFWWQFFLHTFQNSLREKTFFKKMWTKVFSDFSSDLLMIFLLFAKDGRCSETYAKKIYFTKIGAKKYILSLFFVEKSLNFVKQRKFQKIGKLLMQIFQRIAHLSSFSGKFPKTVR